MTWIEPPDELAGVVAEVAGAALAAGVVEPRAGTGFPGPPGRYRLLPEELWRTMGADDPVPVFLHESYEAGLERWTSILPDAAAEVAIVARVRDAVMHLVQTRLAADPEAFSASPTVTTTEPSPRGMVVVGRSVVLQPSRRRHRPASPATGSTDCGRAP
ncbi:hypothetical protein DQ239_16390 [Blastococcus sp. TF02-09]|nr:hypothetical protein DQ239_16390 [Blastococcus sp. TF02-9]